MSQQREPRLSARRRSRIPELVASLRNLWTLGRTSRLGILQVRSMQRRRFQSLLRTGRHLTWARVAAFTTQTGKPSASSSSNATTGDAKSADRNARKSQPRSITKFDRKTAARDSAHTICALRAALATRGAVRSLELANFEFAQRKLRRRRNASGEMSSFDGNRARRRAGLVKVPLLRE